MFWRKLFLKVLDLQQVLHSLTILPLPAQPPPYSINLPILGQIFPNGVLRTPGAPASPPHRDEMSPFGLTTPFHHHFISQHAAAPSKGCTAVRYWTTAGAPFAGDGGGDGGCTREHERSGQGRKEKEAGGDVENGEGYQEEWTR